MAARTDNSVEISAPLDLVWAVTNNVASWTELFSEYAAVEILETAPDYVKFRLTMHPDENGTVWSWVSERRTDRAHRTVEAQRVETGPFEFMRIRWTYEPTANATVMRWTQHFQMKPSAPVDDLAMADRINTNTPVQMARLKAAVEAAAAAGLSGLTVPGVNGTDVYFDGYRNGPLVVILGNRHTQKYGHEIIEAMRSHPQTMSVPVVQVAHLRDVGKPLHPMATRHITAGYRSQLSDLAARRAALGAPPVDESTLLNIALDWAGAVTDRFAFSALARTPLVLVFDRDLRLVTTTVSPDAFATIRSALAGVARPTSDALIN